MSEKMTTEELRELDAWIAFRVLNKTSCLIELNESNCWQVPNYTTDAAAAMEVLKKCCEHAKQKYGHSITLTDSFNGYWCGMNGPMIEPETAETLELAICKFSQKLFSK